MKKKTKTRLTSSLQPHYYSYIFLITDKTIPVRKERKEKKKETARLLADGGARRHSKIGTGYYQYTKE